MSSIQTVIFDVDGTLIDESGSLYRQTDQVAWKFGDGLADRQRVVDAFFGANDRAQRLRDEGVMDVKGDIAWYMQRIGEAVGVSVDAREADRLAADWSAAYHGYHDDAALFSDAVPTLEALQQRGYRLIVASGNTVATREKMLLGTDIRHYFDAIFAAIDVGYQKQDKRFWLALVDAEGTTPEQMAVVGNQLNDDIMHPVGLGMTACFIHRTDQLTKNLGPAWVKPTHTLDNLVDLLSILPPRGDVS